MSAIPASKRALVRKRDRNRCVRCGAPGTAWHHRRGRSVRDTHRHDACNGVTLCRLCHVWVHAHPVEARAEGLIVLRSVPDPSVVPVHTMWGTRLHHCDGTFTFVTQ